MKRDHFKFNYYYYYRQCRLPQSSFGRAFVCQADGSGFETESGKLFSNDIVPAHSSEIEYINGVPIDIEVKIRCSVCLTTLQYLTQVADGSKRIFTFNITNIKTRELFVKSQHKMFAKYYKHSQYYIQ